MIDAVEFKKVVESYYNDFTQRYWDEEEGFKWKAVKAFSEKWDIDSSDFSAMLKAALKEAKPLQPLRREIPLRKGWECVKPCGNCLFAYNGAQLNVQRVVNISLRTLLKHGLAGASPRL